MFAVLSCRARTPGEHSRVASTPVVPSSHPCRPLACAAALRLVVGMLERPPKGLRDTMPDASPTDQVHLLPDSGDFPNEEVLSVSSGLPAACLGVRA
jgi:hypothetical protein